MRDVSFDRAIAFARDLIRIPSLPGAEREIAERVRAELEDLGFDDVWIDAVGNVLGRVRGRNEAPSVMLSCHLDAVDVGDPTAWEHDPFAADLADGHLHGRGAMDIKGPLALQTYAAAGFLDDRPAGDILVAHTVLEERGGLGMDTLLRSGEIRPGAVIIGEATGGDVCIGHRGRAEIIVEVVGVAGHASAPERARNPLAVLPALLPAIERFSGMLGEDPILGASTLAPTMVETLPRSRNVIPDRVRITLDWRVLPGLDREDAVASVTTFLQEHVRLPAGFSMSVAFAVETQRTYTGVEEERRLFTPGFLLGADHPVVRAAARAVGEATGRAPAVRPWTFATDGGYTCGVHGIPTVGFAPGEERYAHTNRERLPLDEASVAFAAYPSLVRAVQAAAAV
jgi:putative selenium metabolism hydrolase